MVKSAAVLQDGMQRMNHRSKVIMEVNLRHSQEG